MKYICVIVLALCMLLQFSGCVSKHTNVVVKRQTMTEKEKTDYIGNLDELSKSTTTEKPDLYYEDGVKITNAKNIEIDVWKLKELAESYEEQNPSGYILESKDMTKQDGDWLSSEITTKDFQSFVRLYGNDTEMTLDMRLEGEAVGKYILAPQSTLINGIVKDKQLFRVEEVESGHFLFTANMQEFDTLSMLGLTMENISSLAWNLVAINTETKKMNRFLLATSFPDDYSWSGLTVSDDYSAASGIILWVEQNGDRTYLCVFNGSNTQIDSKINVTATQGSMISDEFHLEVSSGEFTYVLVGFKASGIEVKMEDNVLLKEKE